MITSEKNPARRILRDEFAGKCDAQRFIRKTEPNLAWIVRRDRGDEAVHGPKAIAACD